MPATVVLDQQVRNGTHPTGSLPVPQDAIQIILTTTMSDPDASDPAKRCLILLSVSYDGTTYTPIGQQSEWVGGQISKDGVTYKKPAAGASVPLLEDGTRPLRAMARFDTEGFSLNFGALLDFVTE